jgi:thiosulfate/3-mercaptopyruvate sulfurtransferase
LPDRDVFARRVGDWGIGPETQVVTYDAQGSPYAARAWWLLRWLGHTSVAVLDGGSAAWTAAGGRLQTTPPAVEALAPYPAAAQPALPAIGAAELAAGIERWRLIDARALERWRGDVEPLDPVAGHIPGSVHRFFKDNLEAGGRFRSAAELREAFVALGAGSAARTVHQCGSGVTACHNILAMAHAGMGISALYPGSWSEWCADDRRPVARG